MDYSSAPLSGNIDDLVFAARHGRIVATTRLLPRIDPGCRSTSMEGMIVSTTIPSTSMLVGIIMSYGSPALTCSCHCSSSRLGQ